MYSCKGNEIQEAVIVSREYRYFGIIASQYNPSIVRHIFIHWTLIYMLS